MHPTQLQEEVLASHGQRPQSQIPAIAYSLLPCWGSPAYRSLLLSVPWLSLGGFDRIFKVYAGERYREKIKCICI